MGAAVQKAINDIQNDIRNPSGVLSSGVMRQGLGVEGDSWTTSSQKCEAVSKWARVQGSWTLYHSVEGSRAMKKRPCRKP